VHSKFTLGQDVILSTNRRGSIPTTVTKVGRLYFSVNASNQQFALDTGYEKGDRHGNCSRVRTIEEQARIDRSATAYRALREHDITLGYKAHRDLPIETIEAIVDLVSATTATSPAAPDSGPTA
jgi:hypothetical protein